MLDIIYRDLLHAFLPLPRVALDAPHSCKVGLGAYIGIMEGALKTAACELCALCRCMK